MDTGAAVDEVGSTRGMTMFLRLLNHAVRRWIDNDPAVSRARNVSLGMDPTDVFHTVGGWCLLQMLGWMEQEHCYGERVWKVRRLVDWVRRRTGITLSLPTNRWPVVVHFNGEHRADWIKRGDEIVQSDDYQGPPPLTADHALSRRS